MSETTGKCLILLFFIIARALKTGVSTGIEIGALAI